MRWRTTLAAFVFSLPSLPNYLRTILTFSLKLATADDHGCLGTRMGSKPFIGTLLIGYTCTNSKDQVTDD
ncbi:hypothetical protein OPQ81_011993 [Rhizoctonia solani]|nr:hypothetical protein OPQ81_011993 [Rhizoctonia solani]